MDALAFIAAQQAPQQQQQQQQQDPFVPLPHGQNMSHYNETSPLGILNAEQYNDGGRREALRAPATRQRYSQTQQQPQPQPPPVFGLTGHYEYEGRAEEKTQSRTSRKNITEDEGSGGNGGTRRKKQKVVEEEDLEDDAAKKARGRPRLDPKDETAADRRRTQIRMAQRAYRHRKETTISSLEKQVQELKGTNEEMSSIFVNLYDFAVGRGILQREPEFGRHLQASTERFLALAKSVDMDETGKEDESTNGESKHGHSDLEIDSRQQGQISRVQAPVIETPPSDVPAWGGYQVDRSDMYEDQSTLHYGQQAVFPPHRQPGHQIIAQATQDNASFPYGFDLLDSVQQYRVEIPEMTEAYQSIASLHDSLPLPKTLAGQEATFGRRLQRSAIERGFRLISSDNPNPILLNHVFGFCLLFETRDGIRRRMSAAVTRTAKDPLSNWKTPFVHLGGAGTYYPMQDNLSANLMPKFRTGRSMGPFSPEVVETREVAMYDDFRMTLPGFEGEFFDSNDVEGYLKGHGITIPPNADFVTISSDLLLNYPSLVADNDSESSSSDFSPKTPRTPEALKAEIRAQEQKFRFNGYINNADTTPMPIKYAESLNRSLSFTDWDVKPMISKDTGIILDLDSRRFDPVPILLPSPDITNHQYQIQEGDITISIPLLVEELISRCVCLGRAAGFRPADVDAALRTTLKACL